MAEIQKWSNYAFVSMTLAEVCKSNDSGVFIFAGKNQQSYYWTAYFVGETHNFKNLKNHPLWEKAEKMGATHVHIPAVYSTLDKHGRKFCAEEIIKFYKPALNISNEQKSTFSDNTNQITQPAQKEIVMSEDFQVIEELQATASKLELLFQYEKHYLDLIKEYKEEIKFASSLQEDLRRERSQFFTQTLREVVQTLQTQEIDKKVASQWIEELVASYTKSIDLSSDLAKTHVVQVLSIFKEEAKQEVSKAKLDNISANSSKVVDAE